MTDKRRRDPTGEEPAVTFEFPEEEDREQPGDRWRRAGVTAASGAALLSGGATNASANSLDVFDDLTAEEGPDPDTTYQLEDETEDPAEESSGSDFPPLDFSVTSIPDDPDQAAADEVMFGAEAGIGGGHVLDDAGSDTESEAFTAAGAGISPSEAAGDHDDPDDETDLDLADLDFD